MRISLIEFTATLQHGTVNFTSTRGTYTHSAGSKRYLRVPGQLDSPHRQPHLGTYHKGLGAYHVG